jgi:phosphatidate cytidylyltransferase
MKLAFIVLISIMIWEMERMFGKKRASVKNMSPEEMRKFSLYKIALIFLLFYPTLRLFALLSGNYNLALFLIFLTLFVTVSADVGAYMVGSNIKTRKVCPSISPNKSLGGFIGGEIFGFVFGMLYILYMGNEYVSWSLGSMILIMLIAPIIAMMGDLFESLVKRFCEVKDSSDLIPGHGGVLDRLDSFLLTLLFFEILVL